jgi:effector-binding domain-containing protein
VTEQQKYEVLETFDGVEIRHYPVCTVADVRVRGSAESAGNAAFRPLVSYISGRNRGARKLAMTAPVTQTAGEKLAMTAPVRQEAAVGDESAAGDEWVVSFVLPGGGRPSDYPEPLDPQVSLRELPAHDAAAVRWSGRWTSANVASHTERLLIALAEAPWQVTGPTVWARYDPPWMPPFARRNEVLVPVVRA